METNKELSNEKAFQSEMAHCLYINNWSSIQGKELEQWQLNELVDFLSDIAHDRIMEEVSYEDYLTEQEAELYRTALSIN